MGEITAGGAEMHPGKPVIWPTSKEKAQSVQTQREIQAAIQAAKSAEAQKTISPQEAAKIQAALKQQLAAETARAYTQADIQNLLIAQNIPVNSANENLAVTMLRYGIEVSNSNFSTLLAMMGANPGQTTIEAAIILFSKGVNSPEAVKTLSQFLSENPQLAAQLMSLKGNVSDLLSALSLGGGIINDKLLAQLTAILSKFMQELENVPKKYKFSGDGSMGRAELSSDMRALQALLNGVPKENLPDTAEGQIIDSNLRATSNRLNQTIEGLTSQALLSKQTPNETVNYSYYQIPNPMTQPMSTVDIIVKRSTSEGGKKIDENNAEIIMSLDTENIGKITVKMVVTNEKS